MSPETWRERILTALGAARKGPLKSKELARELAVPSSEYRVFREALKDLEREGAIYRVKGQRYAAPSRINLVVGTLSLTRNGDGFVVPDAGGKDVFVPGSAVESAMDGDRVVARIEGQPRGRNPEGRIIKILKRAHPTVVGTFREARRFGYVVPLDDRLFRDVMIPQGEDGGARSGEVVVARVTAFGDRKLSPLGEVERVLGPITAPGVDVLSILFGYGLDLEFPPEVEKAAEEAARRTEEVGWPGRTDHRDLAVFTIDPADAKDHDDALSIRPVAEGMWEVGVHIADVSHFVEAGGALDREALKRGTSVYLVDRVVPMLPDLLSANLCSLHPEVDRAAVSCFATLDDSGMLRGHRFERTLIRSRHRLNYDQVQEVLEGKGTIDGPTDRDLHILANLARALRQARVRRGSLDFDLPEARVILGRDGAPLDIQKVVQLESHRLIEEFMLLANETVAREATARRLPIPYRVHEPPSADRVEELRRLLGILRYPLPGRKISGKGLQEVLKQAEGKPEEGLISTIILRSMPRARYQPVDTGHFGLGAPTYTHFTSPIRRYPDLLVHRVITRALLDGEPIPPGWGGEALAAACETASTRERMAADAQRDSVALKKVEFMERHLGEDFDGTVSGVTSFGVFVLLDDFFVEGLLHVNTLLDDFYALREGEYALVGERSGRRFRLGDTIRVRVSRVDRLERKIDFVLVGDRGSGRV